MPSALLKAGTDTSRLRLCNHRTGDPSIPCYQWSSGRIPQNGWDPAHGIKGGFALQMIEIMFICSRTICHGNTVLLCLPEWMRNSLYLKRSGIVL